MSKGTNKKSIRRQGKPAMPKHARDTRSNQLNPNNSLYEKSRSAGKKSKK